MKNYKNYFVYADDIKNRNPLIFVYVPDINLNNIDDHSDAILAILKDGIETEYIHNLMVRISWENNVCCDLYIVDYWYNLIMWKMILCTKSEIRPKHIFWQDELRKNDIKTFIDDFILTKDNKIKFDNMTLNKIICDSTWAFSYIENFALYLANTINNEDNIALMKANPEFRELMHPNYAGVPIEKIKDAGMDTAYKVIDIIKHSRDYLGYDHGLAASFRASEAINARQFKEAVIHIGTKPDGAGSIYPFSIDTSYMNGGVNTPSNYFVDASTSRTAQILSKVRVGTSGDLARKLGLNNADSSFYPDPNFVCSSTNFVKIEIKNAKELSMLKNRYFRYNPKGMEYVINKNDESLIGETIYLRSPITCASHVNGQGYCRRCYGDLYYTNIDISPGKIAAEIVSAQLTQTLLSAKHLLESKAQFIKWDPEFYNWFDADGTEIKLLDFDDEINLKKYYLVIDPDAIYLINEEEDSINYDDDEEVVLDDITSYNEYITSFKIRMPDGSEQIIKSENDDPMYISHEFNNIIRRKSIADGDVALIRLSDLQECTALFYIKIVNNEIAKTMNDIINIIDKSSAEKYSKDEITQRLIDLIISGNLSVDSVHLEVILSNQVINPDNVLAKPDWTIPNVPYKMVSLNKALTYNPSVVVSLLYQNLGKTLYSPLTFSKHAPSFFDLFFCEQPQNYMNSEIVDDDPPIEDAENGIEMVKIVGPMNDIFGGNNTYTS